MAATATNLSPSTTRATSAGAPANASSERTIAGANTTISMEQSSYPDPTPSEQYPSPVTARMAQAAASYDSQTTQQLIGDDEIAPNFPNDIPPPSRGFAQGFAGHNGNEMSNGHARGAGVQDHRYPPPATHGNGPPTTPQQQLLIGGQHTGMDPNQELSMSSESSRRKRSKVSRACDECRRKKSQTQAQEMRMSQLGALPVALRASLDATGDGARMYTPEGYTSAPDDGESLNQGQKRKFSDVQDNQATSPFTQSRFNIRERIASLSGWSMSAQPPNSSTNPNQRHSISIAPDQIFDNPDMDRSSYEFERPFWVQNSFKPSRTDSSDRFDHVDDSVDFPSVHQSTRDLYEHTTATVLKIFPFLPQTRHVFDHHVSNCDNETCYTFTTALDVVANKTRRSEHLHGKFNGSYEKFEHHVRAKVLPLHFGTRSISVNLARLWTLLFMIIRAENDLTCVRQRFDSTDGKLTVVELVRMAVKLCTYLLEITDYLSKPSPDEEPDSNSNLIYRAWNCVAVVATWSEIANGITDLIPHQYRTTFGSGHDGAILGPVLFYLSGASMSIAHIYRTLVSVHGDQSSLLRASTDSGTHHMLIHSITSVGQIRPLPPEFEPYLYATTVYFELLISRGTLFSNTSEILRKAALLADVLCSASFVDADYQDTASFPLFTNHFFNLAVITLLEVAMASTSPQVNDACRVAIQALRSPLQKQLDTSKGILGTNGLFWAEGLLRLIEVTPFQDERGLEALEKTATPLLDFARLARKGISECVAEALGV
ncbi:MAG: hypothetical protein Q9160_007070 [Pyrenula sp. 1 TL-2023]